MQFDHGGVHLATVDCSCAGCWRAARRDGQRRRRGGHALEAAGAAVQAARHVPVPLRPSEAGRGCGAVAARTPNGRTVALAQAALALRQRGGHRLPQAQEDQEEQGGADAAAAGGEHKGSVFRIAHQAKPRPTPARHRHGSSKSHRRSSHSHLHSRRKSEKTGRRTSTRSARRRRQSRPSRVDTRRCLGLHFNCNDLCFNDWTTPNSQRYTRHDQEELAKASNTSNIFLTERQSVSLVKSVSATEL